MVYRRQSKSILWQEQPYISIEKRQSIITLRQGQSIWNISTTLKVSSSVVAKTKRYDETGSHEDRHRKGRPRVTSAAEDKFIRVTSLRNCSANKCFRVQVTDTA
jgi:transposase